MTKPTTRELRLSSVYPILTIQSSRAGFEATQSVPKTAYEPRLASKPELPAEDISVLLIGLHGETEDLVRKVLGNIHVDCVPGTPSRTPAYTHRFREAIINRLAENPYAQRVYSFIIASTEADPIDVIISRRGASAILYGALSEKDRRKAEGVNGSARFAETPEQLAALLEKTA